MIALLYSKIFQYIKVKTNTIYIHTYKQNACVQTKLMYMEFKFPLLCYSVAHLLNLSSAKTNYNEIEFETMEWWYLMTLL